MRICDLRNLFADRPPFTLRLFFTVRWDLQIVCDNVLLKVCLNAKFSVYWCTLALPLLQVTKCGNTCDLTSIFRGWEGSSIHIYIYGTGAWENDLSLRLPPFLMPKSRRLTMIQFCGMYKYDKGEDDYSLCRPCNRLGFQILNLQLLVLSSLKTHAFKKHAL